jgi:uncharacterized RDD family membrane protein YckC
MSDANSSTERAGFWRRVAAFAIDACLISLIVGLAGIVLFVPTGGSIRVRDMVINAQHCTPVDLKRVQDLNLPTPSDFRATHAGVCTRSFFGKVHDHRLVVREVTRSGAATYTRDFFFPVNANGRLVRAFYVDSLLWFLLPLYMLFLEWRAGRTLGKDFMDISVRSLTGAPLSLGQAARRLVVRFLATLLLAAVGWLGFAMTAPTIYWLSFAAAAAATLAITINFAIMTRRRDLPWHDRFAGTEVVRGR